MKKPKSPKPRNNTHRDLIESGAYKPRSIPDKKKPARHPKHKGERDAPDN